ncbi:MAG: MazG family protein [Acidimicrobiales bacterium]
MPDGTAERAGRAAVTVVGLGPAGPELLSERARAVLDGSDRAFLRTARHPAAAAYPQLPSFDHLYESATDFDEVYAGIVDALVAATDAGPVAYAVPGSPLVAERTVALLRGDRRVSVTVEPAMSFLDLAWARLGIDPVESGVRLVDGTRFAVEAAGQPGPLLVAQCWSPAVLSEIKLSLDDDPVPSPTVTVLHHLGLPDEDVRQVRWEELDRSVDADHLTSLWIPELAAPVAARLVALDELVRTLRARCPWDRQQTHASLGRHLLEESYEVLDAIDELTRAGPDAVGTAVAHLEEELGDLLFQVCFHARLGAEEGRFNLADVARGVHDKLVSRHPHVFGEVQAHDAEQVLENWERLKQVEKGRTSVTEGIPMALPALALAAKLQRKATAVPGMTDDPVGDLRAATGERLDAVADAAMLAGDRARGVADDGQSELVGSLLWSVVDLARRVGVDAEEALRSAALRFRDEVREAEWRLSPGAGR